jgi:hypothetical protein
MTPMLKLKNFKVKLSKNLYLSNQRRNQFQ